MPLLGLEIMFPGFIGPGGGGVPVGVVMDGIAVVDGATVVLMGIERFCTNEMLKMATSLPASCGLANRMASTNCSAITVRLVISFVTSTWIRAKMPVLN